MPYLDDHKTRKQCSLWRETFPLAILALLQDIGICPASRRLLRELSHMIRAEN
ncbi:hypothetical protein DOTSEDRAFT_74377 [Dothistroma septosporum NZE10]|uniref:Uncharacterized protein n=1 Tax=Dothistroma septosporum (strain NZE10 / CBS 128990) TaxID=675120 RepID=N1PDW1_DOTSN|nr:hypothetical protein DOTSEDRAFT_74377 [Dothistroma septosporum NZE10]